MISLTDLALRKLIWNEYGIWLEQEEILNYDYSKCGLAKDQEGHILEILRDATCMELEVLPGAIQALEALRQRYRIILVKQMAPPKKRK